MDFRLSEQETALRDLARDFGQRHIRPGLLEREWEMDPEKRFPWDIVEAGSAAGLRTLTVPPEYGGPNPRVTPLARALVIEELAAADPGVSIIFNHSMKDPKLIDELGTPEQRDWFFPAYMRDPLYLTATAGTEPAHGSDWQLPYDDFHFDTTARLDGDAWVINGTKMSISLGAEAKLIIAYAATDISAPFSRGTSMFLVPRGPGVQASVHPKVGLRMINNSRVDFDDVRVPRSFLLGELHGAERTRQGFVGENNLLSAAIKLGIARSAFEEALEYARQRVQGGRPIIQHQAIGLKLGEIFSLVEAMRAMVFRLAWMMENPAELDRKYSPTLLWYGAESCYRASTLAMQVTGCGGGWLTLSGQKHVRDAMMYFPNDGTHTVQLLKVHRLLQA